MAGTHQRVYTNQFEQTGVAGTATRILLVLARARLDDAALVVAVHAVLHTAKCAQKHGVRYQEDDKSNAHPHANPHRICHDLPVC